MMIGTGTSGDLFKKVGGRFVVCLLSMCAVKKNRRKLVFLGKVRQVSGAAQAGATELLLIEGQKSIHLRRKIGKNKVFPPSSFFLFHATCLPF